MGYFNLPDVNWQYHAADTNWSRRFLTHLGLMGELAIGGHLEHEAVKFKIIGDRRKTAIKTSTLDMQ